MPEGVALDLAHARGADAAPRRVDHALGRDVVRRVDHELEVGHDVADLGAVEEARAAHDLVRHARTQEHVLEDAALGVGAVEERHVVVADARAVQLLDLRADPAALVALVGGLVGLHELAVAPGGVEALRLAARVVRHHGVRGVQDVARGAVVLLELDHLGVRVVLLEVEDVLDVGAAPGVDGLVVIAHDHEVALARGQHVGDLVLDVVGVLVLVHRDLDEAVLVLCQDVRMLLEQLVGVDEQVIEVHGVGTLEATLQLVVDAGGRLQGRRVGHALELVRQDQGVLGAGNARADAVEREALGLDVEVGHDLLDEALGVVVVIDGEVVPEAEGLGVLAQDAHAHGVEGADPHAARAARQQRPQALAHLGRGLVGERDGEDAPGTHALVGDHVGDAVREHARLARAGAGQHEQRPVGALGCLALGGVEAREVDGVGGRLVARARRRDRGGRRDGSSRGRGRTGCRDSPRARRRPLPHLRKDWQCEVLGASLPWCWRHASPPVSPFEGF